MDVSKLNNVWKLMSIYNFKVVPDSFNDNFLCSICGKLMIDACQGACGCQYCHKCINDYLSGESKYCPTEKSDCGEELLIWERNLSRVVRMNNSISKLKVECPNESCQYEEELSDIGDHLRLCTKQAMECPYTTIGCNKGSCMKGDVLMHLSTEALTHAQLMIESVQTLRNDVIGLTTELENRKLESDLLQEQSKLKDVQIALIHQQMEEQHKEMAKKITEQKIWMIEQIAELKREQTAEQTKEMAERMAELMSGVIETVALQKSEITETNVEIEKLKEININKNGMATLETQLINNLSSKLSAMMEETEKLMRESEDQREEINIVRQKLMRGRDDVKIQWCGLVGEIKEKIERINNGKEKRRNNWIKWNKLSPNIDADFVWRIDEISKKRETMKGQRIYSDSFYSNNYKFCLKIYIDTNDDIKLSCVIMRGDNDEKLEWPMRLPVTLGIINQDTLRIIKTETYKYDTFVYKRDRFERPKNNMNEYTIGGGIRFINYISIKELPSIMIDDSIIVSCVIGYR